MAPFDTCVFILFIGSYKYSKQKIPSLKVALDLICKIIQNFKIFCVLYLVEAAGIITKSTAASALLLCHSSHMNADTVNFYFLSPASKRMGDLVLGANVRPSVLPSFHPSVRPSVLPSFHPSVRP
jgi:hypothetical protein